MADTDKVYRVLPEIVSVSTGITNAVFVQPVAGQVSVLARLVSGGSLYILPANSGSTYAAATLAAVFATYAYGFGAIGTAESMVELQGPACFYLGAVGGTTVCHLLRKKSDNT